MSAEKNMSNILISGQARAPMLVSGTPLSFWGGVDPASGEVIDQHHPLAGQSLQGRIVALPGGRGSSSGSGVILELLLNDKAPAALIFTQPELILTLGVLVGETLLSRSIPLLCVSEALFSRFESGYLATIENEHLTVLDADGCRVVNTALASSADDKAALSLSQFDRRCLDGDFGQASKVSMEIISTMARLQGATDLLDVSQVHIDACVYNGPSSLRVAEQLLSLGASVKVPTTLNSLSVDQRQWQQQGIDPGFGQAAARLGEVFAQMGATRSFTCAPYLLPTAPAAQEQIAWAESNAVMFANSVLGARTQKYPDFLDVCIALTGRAPNTGGHTDVGRLPSLNVQVEYVDAYADAFWPLLGYEVGLRAGHQIPIIHGLELLQPTRDDLKAFSAAIATTSSSPMFHMSGVTPEADWAIQQCADRSGMATSVIDAAALIRSFAELNTAQDEKVTLIALGNPHFSLTECESLANLCRGRTRVPEVTLIVTLGRDVFEEAQSKGLVAELEHFGAQLVNDTCWCMITEPLIPRTTGAIMTTSAKYAHYGPGLTGKRYRFDTLAACVDVACGDETPAKR